MFYAIFSGLRDHDFPGNHLMEFITFRAGISFALSLVIALILGRYIIARLQ